MDNSNQNSNPNNQTVPQPTWPAQTPAQTPPDPVAAPPTDPATTTQTGLYNNGSVNDYSGNQTTQPIWSPPQTDPSMQTSTPAPMPTDSATVAAPPADTFAQPTVAAPIQPAPQAATAEAAPTIPDFMQNWAAQNNAAPAAPAPQPAAPAAVPAFTMPPPTPISMPTQDMSSSQAPFSPPAAQSAAPQAGGMTPSDQLSPFFSQNDPGTFTAQIPSTSNPNGLQPDTGPSNLSQLADSSPSVNQTPPSPSAQVNPLMPPAPGTSPVLNKKSSKSMNKMLMAAGGVLLLIIFASSGYFIWLSTKSVPAAQSTSLPAEQAPLTNPPKPIVQEPKSAQAATSEAILNPSPSPTASPSAKSAFDILKDRSQKTSTSSAKK